MYCIILIYLVCLLLLRTFLFLISNLGPTDKNILTFPTFTFNSHIGEDQKVYGDHNKFIRFPANRKLRQYTQTKWKIGKVVMHQDNIAKVIYSLSFSPSYHEVTFLKHNLSFLFLNFLKQNLE